jgi:hypothetical protein
MRFFKRPARKPETTNLGAQIDTLLLDHIEALLVLWEEAAVLDEMAKPGYGDPASQAERIRHVWHAQKQLHKMLASTRPGIVGTSRLMAKITGRASVEKRQVRKEMEAAGE